MIYDLDDLREAIAFLLLCLLFILWLIVSFKLICGEITVYDLIPFYIEEQTEEYDYNEIIDKYGLEKGLEIIEILESDK